MRPLGNTVLARFVATAGAFLAAFLAFGGTALALDSHFVPEDTEAGWDGAVATVSFREAEVVLEGGVTTISVKVTVEVTAVCTRGPSTLEVRRSGTALAVTDYPIGDDGTVVGTARVPVTVRGVQVPGYSCVPAHSTVTAVLEDFWTGATLVHRT